MSLIDLPLHWIRAASVRRVFWLGGPLLLYAWTVTGPLLCDDLILSLKAERYSRGETEQLGLFRFAKTDADWQALLDRGTYPWWTSDIGRYDFFRPLAEWSFLLDYRLFGRNPFGHRIVSLALFVIALTCIHRLFMVVSSDPIRAGVATFFFGISQTTALPVTWISNRADLLVLIGVTLAASAYWASWRHGRWRLVALACAGFVFALLAKEVAVALALVVAGHELYLRRRASARRERPFAGIIALMLILIVGLYGAYYMHARPSALGLSVQEAGPLLMLTRLPRTLLLNLAVWTTGFPISVLLVAQPFQADAVAALGAIATLAVAPFLWKSMRGDRAAPFFVLWALLFMLPGLGAFTSTRLICVATVGWAYLLAGLIVPSREDQLVIPALLRHAVYAANGVVSIGCVIGTVLFLNQAELACRQRLRDVLANMDRPLQAGETLVMGEAQSVMEMIGSAERLEFLTGLKDVKIVYLVAPEAPVAGIAREDDHTLVLESSGFSLFGSSLHRHTLAPGWRPRMGDAFELPGFSAELAKTDDAGAVTALRFRFHDPLTSPRLHFHPAALRAIAQTSPTVIASEL